MAVASVTVYPSTTRIENADTTTGWSNDGGGGGIAVEPDIVYQGTGAASRKVSTSVIGRAYTHGSGIDMDGTPATTAHVLLKINATNYNALLSRTSPAMHVKIGSSSSAYYTYYLFGNDNYPASGGFQFIAVAPSVTGYRDATQGSPNLSAVTYFSLLGDFSASSKAENLVFDAIDVGLGLACVGGDGASADATFDDFVSTDEGTSGNRWGYVTTNQGVLFCIGQLAIGQNNTPSAVATEFTDSGKTLVWRNGLVTTGFNRLLLDLGGTGTVVTLNNCSFGSQGQENNDGDRGYTTTEDSRTIFEVTGTTGSAALNSCVFSNFASFTLNNKVTMDANVITNSGQVDVGTGATLTNTSISDYTGAANTSALLWNNANDPDGELDGMSFTKGSGAVHAIEFGTTSPLTMTLRNIDFSGYNASNANNDSTFHIKRTSGAETVTINLIGCTGNFSYRTDGANVNIVNNPVTVKVAVTDANTGNSIIGTTFTAGNFVNGEEYIIKTVGTTDFTAIGAASNTVGVKFTATGVGSGTGDAYGSLARVYLRVANGTGPYPYQETVTITNSGTTATVTHTAHGLSSNDWVLIADASHAQNNGLFQVTVSDANTYTYTMSSAPGSNPTGTITSTFVLINTTVDSNGEASMSKVFSSNQPVTGWARKSSDTPFYKTGPLGGSVSSSAGYDQSIALVPDE